jgi:AraC-like DNA-binding protein
MTATPYLFFFGAAQGLFLALALFHGSNGNRRANRYLAAYLALLSVELLEAGLSSIGVLEASPALRILLSPYTYAQGPVLYLYCRWLTRPDQPMHTATILAIWSLPFLHLCLAWPQLWLRPDIQAAMLGSGEGLEPFFALWHWLLNDVEDVVFAVHFFLFLVLSLWLLWMHQVLIRQTHSSLKGVGLHWLRLILLATLSIYLLWFVQALTMDPESLVSRRLDLFKGLVLVALTYTLGWLGYKQPGIFTTAGRADALPAPTTDRMPLSAPNDSGAVSEKYARSALSPEMAAAILAEAESLMVSEQLYQQPSLSLNELAAHMRVSTNYLSQAINQQRQISFFDFVNSYRASHAAQLLADASITILQAGLDAGFNSKSAFYSAFRKHQGVTPGAYRKALSAASAS